MTRHKKHHESMNEEKQNGDINSVADDAPEHNETDAHTDFSDDFADRLSAAQEQAEKFKDLYARSQAEMDNLRKRTQMELEKRSKFAISAFAADLLTVADNLKRAMAAIPEEKRADLPENIKSLAVGLDMTQKDLLSTLEKNGVKPIDSLGLVFNPNFHKVVSEVEDPTKPAGTIVQEWQTGYTIGGDRVLREAMVVVSKGGFAAAPDTDSPKHAVDTSA